MRIGMTPTEFRRFLDGFGLAMLILGTLMAAVHLVASVLELSRLYSIDKPDTFQGLVLMGLGGALRLLVRIDKRLEKTSALNAEKVR
jgi:hypothetical protein